jgi:hypothetical protein
MSMETTGRLLNVSGTCRRRHACQLAGVLRGHLRCSDYSSGDRFWPGPNTRGGAWSEACQWRPSEWCVVRPAVGRGVDAWRPPRDPS